MGLHLIQSVAFEPFAYVFSWWQNGFSIFVQIIVCLDNHIQITYIGWVPN